MLKFRFWDSVISESVNAMMLKARESTFLKIYHLTWKTYFFFKAPGFNAIGFSVPTTRSGPAFDSYHHQKIHVSIHFVSDTVGLSHSLIKTFVQGVSCVDSPCSLPSKFVRFKSGSLCTLEIVVWPQNSFFVVNHICKKIVDLILQGTLCGFT